MVKGISKRVIVVKSPKLPLFEEAIFIVRENVFKSEGVTAEDVLQEALQVADGYLKINRKAGKLRKIFPQLISAVLGAGAVGIFWLGFFLFS